MNKFLAFEKTRLEKQEAMACSKTSGRDVLKVVLVTLTASKRNSRLRATEKFGRLFQVPLPLTFPSAFPSAFPPPLLQRKARRDSRPPLSPKALEIYLIHQLLVFLSLEGPSLLFTQNSPSHKLEIQNLSIYIQKSKNFQAVEVKNF